MANIETVQFALVKMLDDQLRDIEDSYLETWLMEGMPDGETDEELIDDLPEYGDEWIELGQMLLEARKKEEK